MIECPGEKEEAAQKNQNLQSGNACIGRISAGHAGKDTLFV